MIIILRLCLLLFAAFSLFLLLSCNEDDVTSGNNSLRPRISSITPTQVFAGQSNVRAVITGSNFTAMGSVDMGEGIEILKTRLISNSQMAVRFTVSPNALPGPRTISVRTSEGVSELTSTFSIAENLPPQAIFSINPPNGNKGYQFRCFSFDRLRWSNSKISSYDDGKFSRSANHTFYKLELIENCRQDASGTNFFTR